MIVSDATRHLYIATYALMHDTQNLQTVLLV